MRHGAHMSLILYTSMYVIGSKAKRSQSDSYGRDLFGKGAYVFCSEDVFQQQIDDAVERALRAVR